MKKPVNRVNEVSFTRAQLQWLEKRFPRKIHYPGTDLDAIMFDNGAQDVLQAIRENTAGLTYGEVYEIS